MSVPIIAYTEDLSSDHAAAAGPKTAFVFGELEGLQEDICFPNMFSVLEAFW